VRAWLAALVGVIVVLMVVIGRKGSGVNMSSEIRVAFPYDKPTRFYEPTRIHLAPEYIFLENTFSPLVEVSPKDGSLRPGVAESWTWDGDNLRLKIRRGLKTIDGVEITAKDAEFSLKRVLLRTGNTHGNFQSLVCGAAGLKSIDDRCEGIQVDGDELILRIKGKSAFILPMLSGIDFAVIPQGSVDPKSLDIVDFRNTSGPYFVSQDDAAGKLRLSINPNHYHASKDIPQSIVLYPVDRTDKTASLRLFKEGAVDHVTTIDAARPEEIISLAQEDRSAVLHTTANIRSIVLLFTDRGLKELSEAQRLAIGAKVRAAIVPYFSKLPGYEPALQYFPSFSHGALSDEVVNDIASRKTPEVRIDNLTIKISTVRVGDVEIFRKLINEFLPAAEIEEGKNVPAFTKYDSPSDMPHVAIGGPDTGYHEDISLISYMLVSGTFGMSPEERSAWLAKYMSLPKREERLEMLRTIHEESLRKGILVPLLACPYAAVTRQGWRIELSQLFANNPIWLIKKN
jgi:hypothetical protein